MNKGLQENIYTSEYSLHPIDRHCCFVKCVWKNILICQKWRIMLEPFYFGGIQMIFYMQLIILGLAGVALSAYFSSGATDPGITFVSIILSYALSLLITFIITKREVEKECDDVISSLKAEYKIKIRRLKREHDTTNLEKTIRDGTQTLIKNAVDYFKIENIKNEGPSSAAMQNLQLDKYGQIIELLADFSLILPDSKENQEIVQEEIIHQIDIYRIDEKDFAQFLQRIMDKYLITVNKKIREKKELSFNKKRMKRCPKCAEKILMKAQICKHCGYELREIQIMNESGWLEKGQKLYRSGNFSGALSLFTNAIDLNPKSARAYYSRGLSHEKLGNQSRAVDDLRVATRLGHEKAQKALNILSLMDTQEWKWEHEIEKKQE